MDSLESNKVYAAVLTAGIMFSVAGILGGVLVHPHHLEKTVLKIEGAAETAGAAPEAPKPIAPIGVLLAKADASAGQADTRKYCVSCHNFNEGGAAKVGPDLYGVVGRDVASAAGFDYSSALKKHSGPWTFAELNVWLYSPRGYAPGTKMSFAGIENDKARGDVISYLRTLSAKPEPLPPVEAAPAPAPAGASGKAGSADASKAGGAGGVGAGQQMNQPSANQNQPLAQQSESEQPPQAHPAGASDSPAGAQGKPTNVPSPTEAGKSSANATTLQR